MPQKSGPARTPPEQGRCAEEIAAQWLRLAGLSILDRNRRAGDGEVDLVAREGPTLVFVEVRMRRAGAWVGAGVSIGPQKWRRFRSCAAALARRPEWVWPGRRIRLDAVVIERDRSGLVLRHLRHLTGPAA